MDEMELALAQAAEKLGLARVEEILAWSATEGEWFDQQSPEIQDVYAAFVRDEVAEMDAAP